MQKMLFICVLNLPARPEIVCKTAMFLNLSHIFLQQFAFPPIHHSIHQIRNIRITVNQISCCPLLL